MRRSGLIGFLFFASFFATSITTQAQTKRPMTFEDMMHMKRLGGTAVSPDGKWLGYSVTTVDLEKILRRRSCGCRRLRVASR